jgi:hypothetical protein
LRWANGLPGKLDRLLLPLLKGQKKLSKVTALRPLAQRIHDQRTDIVHRGEFCSEAVSTALIDDCQKFVHGIVRMYEPKFRLAERKDAAAIAAGSRARKKARKKPSSKQSRDVGTA